MRAGAAAALAKRPPPGPRPAFGGAMRVRPDAAAAAAERRPSCPLAACGTVGIREDTAAAAAKRSLSCPRAEFGGVVAGFVGAAALAGAAAGERSAMARSIGTG